MIPSVYICKLCGDDMKEKAEQAWELRANTHRRMYVDCPECAKGAGVEPGHREAISPEQRDWV